MKHLIQHLRKRWLLAIASQFGVTKQHGRDYVMLTTDLAMDVVLSLASNGVRITAYPRLAFRPRAFPYKLFAALLIRNGENALGAWQLSATDREVVCSYSCLVPYRWATVGVIKRTLEASLSEADEVASRYHSIEMI